MEDDYVKVRVAAWAELLAMAYVVRKMVEKAREHTLDFDLVPHTCIVDLERHLHEYDKAKVANVKGPHADA